MDYGVKRKVNEVSFFGTHHRCRGRHLGSSLPMIMRLSQHQIDRIGEELTMSRLGPLSVTAWEGKEEDISRVLAQLTLNLLRIDIQALLYIVDCFLNSGLLFTYLGAVYYIEFGISLKHVYVDECLPYSQPR